MLLGQLFDTRALIDHQPSIAMTNISLTKDRLITFIAPILRNSDLAVLNVLYSFYLPAFFLRRLYLHNKTLCRGNMTLRFTTIICNMFQKMSINVILSSLQTLAACQTCHI